MSFLRKMVVLGADRRGSLILDCWRNEEAQWVGQVMEHRPHLRRATQDRFVTALQTKGLDAKTIPLGDDWGYSFPLQTMDNLERLLAAHLMKLGKLKWERRAILCFKLTNGKEVWLTYTDIGWRWSAEGDFLPSRIKQIAEDLNASAACSNVRPFIQDDGEIGGVWFEPTKARDFTQLIAVATIIGKRL
ncbi:MAG TPA: hypothetical protein VFZ48_00620 [Candidatus Saccharimonadales bacterium]